jgi:putative ABC transport system permease protein
MNGVIDIGYWDLLWGYALLIVPIYVLWYYKTGLVKDGIISIARMSVQLFMVGLYLEYIFDLNNTYINITWVFIMTVIAAYTVVVRSGLKLSLMFIPVFLAGFISIGITDAYFLGYVIKLDNMFEARYFIPITGMLLGNTLKTIIISLSYYFKQLDAENGLYNWYLANGATRTEALTRFKREALKIAFNPVIAATAIVGLISLPGMMTGQILGGSSPNVAIKYQIMLMITVFSSSIISVILTLLISDRHVFDRMDNIKDIYKKK